MFTIPIAAKRILAAILTLGLSVATHAATPPNTFDLTLGLVPDFDTTIYTDNGHEVAIGSEVNDPDLFRSLDDCDCYDGDSSTPAIPGCTDVNAPIACFCRTIAQTHYVLYFSDDLAAGVPLYQLARTDYALSISDAASGETWSANFPRLIANGAYPGVYGYNFGYEAATETATTFAASNFADWLRPLGDELQLLAQQRTSDRYPWPRCEAYTILGDFPYNIWLTTAYTTVVDTDYHRIQDLNDFPTIELVEESTGRVFVYRALSLLGPEPGRKIARVRYGDACPKGSEDAFGRCHGIEPERNLGGEDCVVGSFHGNPVNAALGNKYQHEVDYSATGVIPLRWERHYNSHTGRWTSISRINHEPGSVVAKVEHSNGRVIPFTQVNSEWISYPDVQKKLLQLFDEGGAVSGWRYVHEDGFVEIFSPLGKLVEQRHRSGYHISYDHSDPFLVITDPAGRGLIVAYNAEGRVLAVTTPNGQTLTYAYDSLGRLVRVNYGDSSEKFYRYGDTRHPLALTAVIDELGVETATWTYDDQGRAVSYNGPNGVDRVAMDYSQINDRFDPSVTVTNALGKQTTYRFVDQHGARKVASVTGHASENCAASHRNYEYDASGWLVGNEDWDGIRTEYLRDDRGRVMEMIEAVGTTLERSTRTVWHSEWNLPLRREKGGRRTEFIYDSVGNLLHMEQFDISQ